MVLIVKSLQRSPTRFAERHIHRRPSRCGSGSVLPRVCAVNVERWYVVSIAYGGTHRRQWGSLHELLGARSDVRDTLRADQRIHHAWWIAGSDHRQRLDWHGLWFPGRSMVRHSWNYDRSAGNPQCSAETGYVEDPPIYSGFRVCGTCALDDEEWENFLGSTETPDPFSGIIYYDPLKLVKIRVYLMRPELI